ncbi:MAG: polysaccharide biosynthesis/export family protein, partial [Deltaproteobacteria bacterium]
FQDHVGGRGYRLMALLFFLGIALWMMPSCNRTTAVMGTPVNEAPLTEEEKTKRYQTEEVREALAEMSMVDENQAFTELSGVPEYRIGPGDVLEVISHVGDQGTTNTITVNSRGRISYSFIDDLEVAGLTPSELDALLTKKLSSYVRRPRIDVLVKEFNSKTATVIGELGSLRATTYGKSASGRINLKGKTTLMDLIAQAGGYTVDADIRNVRLVRKGESYLINVYDIIEKGDQTQNVIIDNGDVVTVPELPTYGERVYVMGEVNAQGVYPLDDAQDLLAALALAGNFTRLAREENTLIVRGYEPGKKPLVMMADINALFRKADLSQNVRLKDGDLVYVPRTLIGDINEWILNVTPMLNLILYPYEFDIRYFKERKLTFD